jgi:hypothetical protein
MSKKSQGTDSTIVAAEHKLEEFAEDLGKLLGNARNKAEGWIGQRDSIAKYLTGIQDTASSLLAQLGVTSAGRPAIKAKPGQPRTKAGAPASATPAPPAVSATGGKAPRTMSAEARARISAAQKKRWAKLRKTQGK